MFSVENQIIKYCADFKDSWHASGSLQRVEWRNKDNSLATPRSVVRRLQELENAKILAVQHQGKKGTAEYRYIPLDWRHKYVTLKEREEKNLTMWGQPIKSPYQTPLQYHED